MSKILIIKFEENFCIYLPLGMYFDLSLIFLSLFQVALIHFNEINPNVLQVFTFYLGP